ncbi:MAG: hypothetical protein CM15mV25_1860 [uncultured marine virus]|nr:MAG: hypothetical protein CM15mV25_1860 [uncultured marine virus]
MKPRDWGWSSGTTREGNIKRDTAKADNPDETISLEVYLIDHDLGSNTDKINNLYKDTKYYGLKEQQQVPPTNWIGQLTKLIKDNPS